MGAAKKFPENLRLTFLPLSAFDLNRPTRGKLGPTPELRRGATPPTDGPHRLWDAAQQEGYTLSFGLF
jgi:hypothetical protein